MLLQTINRWNPGTAYSRTLKWMQKATLSQVTNSKVLQSIHFHLGKSWDHCKWRAEHTHKSLCLPCPWTLTYKSLCWPLSGEEYWTRKIFNQMQWLLNLHYSLLIGETRIVLASTHPKHRQTDNNPTYNCLFFTNNYLEGFKHCAGASTCSFF